MRVLIVDDHRIVASGCRALFADDPDIDIIEASEVDRYIIYPGQATAYMLGKLEISKARAEAQQAMGTRFDLKQFHDRVLEDGAIPVSFLHAKIRAWAVR